MTKRLQEESRRLADAERQRRRDVIAHEREQRKRDDRIRQLERSAQQNEAKLKRKDEEVTCVFCNLFYAEFTLVDATSARAAATTAATTRCSTASSNRRLADADLDAPRAKERQAVVVLAAPCSYPLGESAARH